MDPEAAARAQSVTAVDAAAEVLALARARTASPTVQFLEADLFEWQPPRRYDTVFFAFWLSHVPPTRLPDFWNTVATALAPGGKAVFIDDGPAAAAEERALANQPAPAALRRLDDGSQYRIVKVFHDVRTLTDDLTALGWSVRIWPMSCNFIGIAEPPTTPGPKRMSSSRSTDSRPMLSSRSTTEAQSGAAGSSANANRNGRLAVVHAYTSPWRWAAL
ncbi:Methyltransferase domain-containing protein [Streptomyces mirabilis]|uniref:Methyltransferase domain-containing protein n=1 Tax=Streptomyces mirabilis TaxID=68239 RepID=A0A1I2WKQ0_9ACTN|nr:Methyltransferase domain-containing protein [Streptomyces mirabilis]